MYTEDELLPISALQHYAFCPRQCALIHLEGIWDENRFTAEGRVLHDKTHEPFVEKGVDIRIVRSLRLHSFQLGLTGQSDVVEFHRLQRDQTGGVCLEGISGKWMLFPVEYKRGKPKKNQCDTVQLCAQAICLEEMLNTTINEGAIFYGKPRRRHEVIFSENLRKETEELALGLHKLIRNRMTPVGRYGKKCDSCSLLDVCMPKVTGVKKNIAMYLAKAKITNMDSEI